MKEGQPFLTEELDRLRARQRELLRKIEDWLIRTLGPGASGIELAEDIDAPLVELELRRMATEEEKQIEPLLQQMEVARTGEQVGAFLRARIKPVNQEIALDAGFWDVANEFAKEGSASHVGKHPEGQQKATLARLIAYLVWADELADDGYSDPRLK